MPNETQQSQAALLAAALGYGRGGWPVFPLNPRAKLPDGRLAPHGFKSARADEASIRRWWELSPNANVGIPTGPSTFDVLDIDGPDGEASLAALLAVHGELPSGPWQSTGRGRQLLFRGGSLRTGAAFLPGIDARSTGGYVVVAPSVHPSGVAYELHDRDARLPDPPVWLVNLLSRKAAKVLEVEPAVEEEGPADSASGRVGIPVGKRHAALLREAGRLRQLGTPQDEALKTILGIARACQPAFPHAEAEALVRDVWKRYPGPPSASDIVRELGFHALPNRATQTDLEEPLRRLVERARKISPLNRRLVRQELFDVLSARGVRGAASLIDAALETAARTPRPKPRSSSVGLPRIQAREELSAVADEALELLAKSNPPIYTRGGLLVRVSREAEPPSGLRRERGAPSITALPLAALREHIDRAAEWYCVDGEGADVPAIPPHWVAETIAARNAWPFPPLVGLADGPILRPDGTVCPTSGYDPDTGTLVELTEEFPCVAASPSKETAQRAAAELLDVIRDFPCVEACDRSVFLATVLSIVGRPAICGPTPLTLIRATAPGSGKTLLANVIALIGTGRPPVTMAPLVPGRDDEECRKRIFAIALAGDPVVNLDNVVGALGGAPLAMALTAGVVSDRVLGESRRMTLPVSCVWMATGNNVTVRTDLGRRVLPIDLEAECEHPEDRVGFAIENLESYVRRQRPTLLVAALTILRAHAVAGRPGHDGPRKGSYEQWDDIIRSAVIWLGQADPLGGLERIRQEADADLEALRALVGAWRDYIGEGTVTVSDLIGLAERHEDLRTALTMMAPPRGGAYLPDAQKLSYVLRSARGRIVGDRRLVRAGESHRGRVRWRLEVVAGSGRHE